MSIYSDIKIEDNDLARDGVNAVVIYDRDVILQDLRHAILESGLLVELVGERVPDARTAIEQQIVELAEEDFRIIPGSVTVTREDSGLALSGDTYEFGSFTERITHD